MLEKVQQLKVKMLEGEVGPGELEALEAQVTLCTYVYLVLSQLSEFVQAGATGDNVLRRAGYAVAMHEHCLEYFVGGLRKRLHMYIGTCSNSQTPHPFRCYCIAFGVVHKLG